MQASTALLVVVGALLCAAAVAVPSARRQWATTFVYAASLIASVSGLVVALGALLSGTGGSTVLPLGLPWIGARFAVDALSAFFLTVINLGAAAASLYALGYGRHEEAPQRVLPFYPAFLAGMNLVVLAADAFTFLLSWEFMSLASWAMVLAHHREAENRRAATVYLVMAGFGTMALLLAFGLMAGPDGGYSFAAMREAARSPLAASLVLVLALAGAGSKAGLAPLHVWLPLAHPAAPSHVSALMSGVMTKVAVYGFIRIVFDLVGEPAWWAALPLLALGGATAILGILHALMERDIKRMLAYSTIENIGIVFACLGLALAFRSNGMEWAAALALTAALFHVLNHALFKSLLFFGAGAVLTATGARDMERLGGLIHRMPATALFFLVGALAISALPPLNGFISEWLAFQAILQSPEFAGWGLRIAVPALGGMLALSAALAAACFVRAFGVSFLGRPRSTEAGAATEVDRFSLAAMGILAATCLLAGILPGFVIDALAPVTELVVGGAMPVQADRPWLSIVPIAESRSSYNGLLVFLFIVVSATGAAALVHRFASRGLRRAPAWDCGLPVPDPATQYSASGFAQPFRRIFGRAIFSARDDVTMPAPGDMRPARLTTAIHDPVWERIYVPLAGAVDRLAGWLNRLQFLTIRRYLTLVFLFLIALLLVLALWT
jgi:formate hydrogenlyase subunit 3/multisubunit Na+/H+ antiporter MnhD subunit